MSRKNIGEKRQSFSMRKLSVGLVSVTVASFFLMSQGIQSVSADHMESPIHYKYMTEGELTDEEKSLLVEALPQLAEESDDTYYLVYRPQQFLPNTGFNPTVGTFLFTAGLSLLVLLVSKRENGKKRLVHFLLLTSMGVQLLPASAFGLTSQILSAYNSQFAIGVGEQLPEPLKIEGYQYIGYIKTKKQDNAGISRTVDGKYSARSDSQPDSTKTSDVVHSADLEWNKGQGKLSLQGETSGDDGLSEKSSIAAENLSSNDSLASQGEQNPGHKGESVVRPTLPEQGNPVSATTVQSAEEEVLATTNDRPEYKLPLETKGTQEPGHEGEAAVREETPEYTKPLATKGTQESGHEGEAVVQPELPEYTDPVSTKGTQEPGHEGEAAVREETPEYTNPVSTKGTQEPGHEGKAAVREESPAYTEPLATKGTQEPGHEGEAAVQPELPEYTDPVSTKGTQEPGHEGETTVREESPAYTEPLATKGTQEPGHEGEAAAQPELPEYKVSEEKKGTQEPGHEGEAAVQPELPEYTDPVATKGTQEPGHEGEATVREESPAYTEPLATKGTQEPGHEGEAAVREESPAYTEPLATKGTQEPGHEGEAVVREESPAYTDPLETKGTQEPGHEGEAAVREEEPVYTEPLATKGTQEPGHEGEAVVQPELPEYTDPVATKGTQEPGHEGEAAVQPELPEYTDPVATKGTQEPSHEGEAAVREETPEYTKPLETKGTQEPGHEGESVVTEELPALEVTTRNRTETENIPYTTEEIQDSTLLKNRRRTERQGQAGTRTIQYEDYIVDGNVVETKELSRTEVPPVKQIVKVGTLVKVKPTVEIANLTKAENKKSITVSYNLTDSTSAYVSAKAQIFQGDQLIKEVDIENPAKEQVISGLDYYTPYTLKTRLTYNLGENDEQSTETSTQNFQLDYKKIEIKDIDSVELYGKENDRYRRYLSLSEAPTDTAKYFVKVKSDRFKEMYLPVKSITENADGTYKVTAAVDQLVEEGTDGYKDDYTFTVAKSKAEQPGVYTSFKQLVTAMKSNLAGVYKLAADMSADEVGLPENQTSYITGEFTGTLVGAEGSKAYAIYDLKKPLFDTLKNATVKDLDLKKL